MKPRRPANLSPDLANRELNAPPPSVPNVIVPPAQPAGLLKRALTVANVAPRTFARMYGLPYPDVYELYHGSDKEAEAIDRHPVWACLNDFVNDQYGALTGVREEIQRKLAQDVREREARRNRTL